MRLEGLTADLDRLAGEQQLAASAAFGLQGVPLGRRPVGRAAGGTYELSHGHGSDLRA
jgi:hypothetical protein